MKSGLSEEVGHRGKECGWWGGDLVGRIGHSRGGHNCAQQIDLVGRIRHSEVLRGHNCAQRYDLVS